MKFQAFHVNPGEKLKKKDVNNDLSNFMSVFPSAQVNMCILVSQILRTCFSLYFKLGYNLIGIKNSSQSSTTPKDGKTW